jgi:hypothetical protein
MGITDEQMMGHEHNHTGCCQHENVKFCKKCGVVYCTDCGYEWFEKCTLNHSYPWYVYPETTYPNYPRYETTCYTNLEVDGSNLFGVPMKVVDNVKLG